MTLTELLAERRHLLLDFDGPVCAVFGGIPAPHVAHHYAAILRTHGIDLPTRVDEADDPFDVFRAAVTVDPDRAVLAEHTLRDLEVHAAATATLTPGIVELLDALHHSGHTVTIVSNNSSSAVAFFLACHNLNAYVRSVVGRTDPDPALLKPHPHLVQQAVCELHTQPGTCVLLGDSTTDITAAHAADTAVIAYANKPGKRDVFAVHDPDAIVDQLANVTEALTREAAR